MTKKSTSQGDNSTRELLRWSEDMDAAFLDALIEECAKGNRVDRTFTTTEYDNVLGVLRLSFGNQLRKENLKNRLKTLNDNFGICYDLFHGLSGFSWNPMTRIFEAEPEVRNELIMVREDAKKWMCIPIKHYDKLLELYGKDRAMGKLAGSAKEKAAKERVNMLDKNKEIFYLNGDDVLQSFNFEQLVDGQDTPHSTGHGMEHSPEHDMSGHSHGSRETTSRGAKRKKPMNDLLEAEMERMSAGIQALTDVIKDENYYYEKSIELANKNSMIAEEHLKVAERQANTAERQADIAERGLLILQQSKP